MHEGGLANWALTIGRQRLGLLELHNHPQFLQNLDLRPRLDGKVDVAALDIIRDRASAFIGSQSLRQLELDARREIGLILRDASVVKQLVRTFEEDCSSSAAEQMEEQKRKAEMTPGKMAKKIAKSIAKKGRLTPVARKVAKAIAKNGNLDLKRKKAQEAAEEIVKDVVAEAAEDAAKETVKAVAKAG